MWISRQIISSQSRKPSADMAVVTDTDAARGSGEYLGLPFAGPWGIAYLPPNEAQAVIVSTSSGDACVGTLTREQGLKPGELLLYSSGGAKIYLKSNGDIEINGQLFKKEGS